MDTLRSLWQQRSLRFWFVVGLLLAVLPAWLLVTLGYAHIHREIMQPLVEVGSGQGVRQQRQNDIDRSLLEVSRLLEGPSAEEVGVQAADVAQQRNGMNRAFDRLGSDPGELDESLRTESNAIHQRALAAVQRLDALALVSGLFVLVLGAAGVWLLNRALIESMSRLSAGAVGFARGDWNHRIEVRHPQEVAEVAQALNTMRESIVSQQRELAALSMTDQLTGLNNCSYFEQALRRELLRAQRFSHQFCVIVLDIDRFANINDRYGSQQGDEVLKRLGEFLQGTVRQVDLVCRCDGDRFLFIMPHCGLDQCRDAAGRLWRVIAELPIILMDGTAIAITGTFGAAVYPDHSTTPEGLVRRADSALYEAKRQGRNRVLLAGESVAEASTDH